MANTLSWKDAIATCNTLSAADGLTPAYRDVDTDSPQWDRGATGYRLATEAEWQYACKAGTSGYRYGEIDEIAWYSDNSEGRAHPVGTKTPNNWGLYDMIGNVFQWTEDCFGDYAKAPHDGRAAEANDCKFRVVRGGSWTAKPRFTRSGSRDIYPPENRNDVVGFRLAR